MPEPAQVADEETMTYAGQLNIIDVFDIARVREQERIDDESEYGCLSHCFAED